MLRNTLEGLHHRVQESLFRRVLKGAKEEKDHGVVTEMTLLRDTVTVTPIRGVNEISVVMNSTGS